MVDAGMEFLSPGAQSELAEIRVALEVSPWSVGRPYVTAHPERGMRSIDFDGGDAVLIFAIIDRDRWVELLQLTVL
ncbi:hypothetical protein [Actinomycetospora termitidis]|uniref:Uncharacterized protein n=1 Tax=Actinomycetospora termitidis TaxID=3053470 RepID=A0ABT7M509_9PSEU|nr:hypothetical protein [Actinomycetospora sp. Odt1-22]MDL5155770.1 hypothetical protein [Actinomycetospora sp. Odt1-22]